MRFDRKKFRQLVREDMEKKGETPESYAQKARESWIQIMAAEMNMSEEQKISRAKKIVAKHLQVQPQEYFRLEAMAALYNGIVSGNFVVLKKTCEYAHVSNQEIYDSSFTMVSDLKMAYPELAVFLDMIYVIGEKAKKDCTISYYVHWLNRLEEGRPKKEVPRNFQDFLNFYNSPQTHETMLDGFYEVMETSIERHQKLFYGRMDRGLDIYKFNDGDSVLTSIQYTRYLEKRYDELAKYVETIVKHPVDKESVFDELLECYCGKTIGLHRMITAGANAVSDNKDFRFSGADVRKSITASDIKELVKSWMCGFVLCEMDKYKKEHHEDISKLYLARKLIPAPERVYNDVGFLVERLVLDKKANRLVDEQYRNFTWESVIKGSEAQKRQETIDELRCALDTCQQKLKTANESLDIYREKVAGMQKEATSVKDSAELGHVERRYENMLAERDEEIARLQRELNSREQYIEIISTPVSDTKNEQAINPDIMYTKKYLFVGVIRDEFVELKRKFPNSIFMETAQYNLSNVKVDMIVYLIPSMSHALFYKVQNTNSLNDVRRIYCNNRSVNNVLLNIYTALMDE